MLSVFARLMLTATSIAPVGMTYAWVAIMQDQPLIALYAAAVSLVAVALCLAILRIARTQLEAIPFKCEEIEAADSENIGFMILYLLPLFTDKISTLNWEIWIPTILVFGIIIGLGYGYHFNPLLGLLRWHFYKVTSENGVKYVVLTKKQIRSAAEKLTVGQLTEYILIDLGDDS
jgi:hypothetical protein